MALAPSLARAADAQVPPDSQPSLEIYGFVEADAITDLNQNNPNWYDVNRPSQLPVFPDEFGENGHFSISPRQSRFGAHGLVPTAAGDVTATFEFDMLGVGQDAGLTAIRLRHAWGQWKRVGAGLTYSAFMDPDVYPKRFEAWGPNGMQTSRNAQVFWQPYVEHGSNVTIAAEIPGAALDGGKFADRVEFHPVANRFPMPDITGHYRQEGPWGHIQVSGVLRYIGWDDLIPHDPLDFSGHVWGWGFSISSNAKPDPDDLFRLEVVYGDGIENYINDAPIDVGIRIQPSNEAVPLAGVALPVFSMVAYLDHKWSDTWFTSAGYSRVDVTNSNGQTPDAFRIGQYATANLVYTPMKYLLIGGEFQWARRQNFSDGFSVNDFRLVFSVRCNFSIQLDPGAAP